MIFSDFMVGLAIIAVTLIIAAAPVIAGAVKKHRILKPVEFLPPRGASPIDVLIGYYGASATPREIFNPLILYWASRGFITVEEDCKRGLKLTKLKDLEPPEDKDGFNVNTYDIEKKLFNRIFSGNKKVFYTLTAPKSFQEFFEELTNDFKKEVKAVTSLKTKVYYVISLITAGFAVFLVGLLVLLAIDDGVVATMMFALIAIYALKFLFAMPESDGGMPKGSAVRFLLIPFFLLWGGVPFSVGIMLIPLEGTVLICSAVAVCILIVYYLAGKIDIRTNEQLKTYARICGFKEFLLKAEKRQLEVLVEDDPQYFFNILPYCYVLKITEKLKPKFDRIVLDGPAWYLGELRDILMF